MPTMGHWTDVFRMRAGKPVVVHGDGTSQWTLTHADDFAVAFVGLCRHPAAIGEDFTITGRHAPTWNQICTWLGHAAGFDPELVHVASAMIAMVSPDLGPGWSATRRTRWSSTAARCPHWYRPSDHCRVPRRCVEYHDGAAEQIASFDADPNRQTVDGELGAVFDRLIAGTRSF